MLGLAAAAAATWVSLRLLPPEGGRVRLGALMLLGPHFLWESVRAGVDVARRALAPRMTLEPGFVTSPTRLPRGVARNTFSTVASLMPGTLPAGEDGESLVVHCAGRLATCSRAARRRRATLRPGAVREDRP